MIYFFVFIFVFIIQFSFAEIGSPYDLIAPISTDLNSPQKLTARQVQEDLGLLDETIKKCFSGKFYFSQAQLEKLSQSLLSIHGDMNTSDFWISIDNALISIPDNHTYAAMFLNGSYLMTPRRMSQFRKPQVGKNKISDPSKIWEISKIGVQKDIALIAISRFPPSQDVVWTTFLETLQKNLEGTRGAIIDLRSNSGGDDFFGMEMAKIFWGGPFHHLIQMQFNNTSAEALAIFANHFRLQSISTGQEQNLNSIPERIVTVFRNQVQQALNNEIPLIQVEPKTGSDPKATVTQAGYKKPIYILSDAMTASSGEFTALAFHHHPYAKLLGENSAGFIHFGNAGKVLLPNSKIEVSISTQFSQLESDLFFEKTGIPPSVNISPGSDAFYTAITSLEHPNESL